jgi:hypothetical protein
MRFPLAERDNGNQQRYVGVGEDSDSWILIS